MSIRIEGCNHCWVAGRGCYCIYCGMPWCMAGTQCPNYRDCLGRVWYKLLREGKQV